MILRDLLGNKLEFGQTIIYFFANFGTLKEIST